jgi:glutathione peroxidase-family protein
MKLDDPQTVSQYPSLRELYAKYGAEGLTVLAFPTEQGYFEPDDDETIRAKSKEYYAFGDYPKAVVFDKVKAITANVVGLIHSIHRSICWDRAPIRSTVR